MSRLIKSPTIESLKLRTKHINSQPYKDFIWDIERDHKIFSSKNVLAAFVEIIEKPEVVEGSPCSDIMDDGMRSKILWFS